MIQDSTTWVHIYLVPQNNWYFYKIQNIFGYSPNKFQICLISTTTPHHTTRYLTSVRR